MRKIPFYPLLILLLVGMGGYLGCDPNTTSKVVDLLETEVPLGQETSTPTSAANTTSIPARTSSTIIVGSFNLQRLGPSKLSDAWVMDKLATIIRQFDVIALQEITSVDQRTLPILVNLINSQGVNYSYTISPRIGREGTGYYEQYAFVFDASRMVGGQDYSYVVNDDRDMLHREPFVGRFRSLYPNQPFAFTLINVHTDPDEIKTEIPVLADVYRIVRQYEYPEDDVILLGDLNVGPNKMEAIRQIPGIVPLVTVPTNTRQSKSLDNIIIDQTTSVEFTGRAGTVDMAQMFGIQLSDTERISDHLPVWAEFTAGERVQDATATAAGAAPAVLR